MTCLYRHSPFTHVPQEYVADVLDVASLPTGTCPDEDTAVHNIINYLHARIAAVLERDTRRPIVLLSGGIDSILVAAIVAKSRPDALAVTVDFTPPTNGGEDAGMSRDTVHARHVAHSLGLEQRTTSLDPHGVTILAKEVVEKLGTADTWETLAAMTLRAADALTDHLGVTGPMFTGAGADALFLGGDNNATTENWHDRVVNNINTQFTRDRKTPDFYERLLDEPERHIQVWQTTAAVELALALRPEHVRGANMDADKKILRDTAVLAGVPADLTHRPKSPMQVSSGGVDALVWAARMGLSDNDDHNTYADPLTEPIEHTAARLWLQQQR